MGQADTDSLGTVLHEIRMCGPLCKLGFRTSIGLPTVLPAWVQVQFVILSHRATPHLYPWLYGYFTG